MYLQESLLFQLSNQYWYVNLNKIQLCMMLSIFSDLANFRINVPKPGFCSSILTFLNVANSFRYCQRINTQVPLTGLKLITIHNG